MFTVFLLFATKLKQTMTEGKRPTFLSCDIFGSELDFDNDEPTSPLLAIPIDNRRPTMSIDKLVCRICQIVNDPAQLCSEIYLELHPEKKRDPKLCLEK